MRNAALIGTRTWMYVPADQRDKLDKALTACPDAILADLEDAVAASGKKIARESLAAWLDSVDPAVVRPHVWVRINGTSIEDDLGVAVHPVVQGICLPKVESTEHIRAIDELLDEVESGDSMRRPLMLMIETARGVLRCHEYAAASRRVAILQLGEQDLRADLGLPPDLSKGVEPVPGPLQAARDAIVIASAAGDLPGPIGPVSLNIHDADLLASETKRLRHAGFSGRALIHPAQLAPIASGFAPSAGERAWAQRVIDAAEQAEAKGSGVTMSDGGMVDAPIVATVHQLLEGERSGH